MGIDSIVSLVCFTLSTSALGFVVWYARQSSRHSQAASEELLVKMNESTRLIIDALDHTIAVTVASSKEILEAVEQFSSYNTQIFDGVFRCITELNAAHNETHAKQTALLDGIVDSHHNLHASTEQSLREIRGRLQQVPGARNETPALDLCGHCGKLTAEYFIDGAGRSTCPTCKPEGFADAVKRGTAKKA